jgi:hypothetical protein
VPDFQTIHIVIQDYRDEHGRERVRTGFKPSVEEIQRKVHKHKKITPAEDYALILAERIIQVDKAAQDAQAAESGILRLPKFPKRRN